MAEWWQVADRGGSHVRRGFPNHHDRPPSSRSLFETHTRSARAPSHFTHTRESCNPGAFPAYAYTRTAVSPPAAHEAPTAHTLPPRCFLFLHGKDGSPDFRCDATEKFLSIFLVGKPRSCVLAPTPPALAAALPPIACPPRSTHPHAFFSL